MTGWSAVRRSYGELREAADGGAPIGAIWERFSAQARAVARETPEHLSLLLGLVEQKAQDRDPADVVVLDHGCGSGLTLLVLAALGFTNVHGFDLDGDKSGLNRVAREALGHPDDRFRNYDGALLPLPDASVDVVLSQQVLEHVRPAVFATYYREEARVLRPGGFAYHQVPHRLVPYESHTRTWLLHYLPRPLFLAILRPFRSDIRVLEMHLYLRWPWRHKSMARTLIGPVRDLTLTRLKSIRALEAYDGARGLRRLIDRAIDLPVVGNAIGGALTSFVQIDTVAVKPDRPSAG